MIIVRCFFDDFSSKEKIKQNLGNHQKIIVLLEKKQKTCQNLGFSRFFQQNDDFLMIFWWFPRVLLDFLFWRKTFKNHQKIIIFIIAFIILKKYHFFYHSVCPLRTPASIPRNFFVSKSSWQTCWRWLSQGLNSARLPCTWTLGTWCQDI